MRNVNFFWETGRRIKMCFKRVSFAFRILHNFSVRRTIKAKVSALFLYNSNSIYRLSLVRNRSLYLTNHRRSLAGHISVNRYVPWIVYLMSFHPCCSSKIKERQMLANFAGFHKICMIMPCNVHVTSINTSNRYRMEGRNTELWMSSRCL
ncbi:hypothetical protein ACFW04_006575 [Cataglyphis niger]